MKTMENIKMTIKESIWDLKESGKEITVKNVFDASKGAISFTDMPLILEYLESIKDSFLWTRCKGYLSLTPFGKATVKDLVSR